jgi:hypothetical protein
MGGFYQVVDTISEHESVNRCEKIRAPLPRLKVIHDDEGVVRTKALRGAQDHVVAMLANHV